jgi:hypothetical protein
MPEKQPSEIWKDAPEEHDFPAASDFLTLLFDEGTTRTLVAQLRATTTVGRKAKDLMRASRLPLLPADNPEVAKDMKRVKKGEALSPVLVVRGDGQAGLPMIVADGYHRLCASYHLTEDTQVRCRIARLG